MRVLVTRPEPECAQWVRGLAARGLQAQALPLIRIVPVQESAPVQQAWQQLPQRDALMFVSGAAAVHFFAARPAGAPMPAGLRCWAPGPGTVAALVRLGVPAGQVDAPDADGGQFDSEALWRVVQPAVRAGWRVLVVRGGEEAAGEAEPGGRSPQGQGRDWPARTLEQAGATVEFVMAYERGGPLWTDAEQALAQAAAADGSLWLFTSSQALAHLTARLPRQDWRQARAMATHPRIAQAARDAGFGVVWESRPRLEEVVASIESLA